MPFCSMVTLKVAVATWLVKVTGSSEFRKSSAPSDAIERCPVGEGHAALAAELSREAGNKELRLLQVAASKSAEGVEGDTCAALGSCGQYKKGASCQCNSRCHDYKNCCADFEATCKSLPVHHGSYRPRDPSLLQPSNAPLLTFYVYRAQSSTSFAPVNTNVASLGGVLWYLHNEIVPYCYTTPRGGEFGYRRYKKTRILRYKVTVKATAPLIRKGMNFGTRVAFDSGKNTGAYGMTKWYEAYGYVVGCNILGHGPFPTCPSAAGSKEHFCPISYGDDAVWYSLPGPCPSKTFWQKSDSCKQQEPGGFCKGTPTGRGDCTWTYEDAGEIDLDELSGIKGRFRNYRDFCKKGCLEYVKFSRKGRDKGRCGVHYWDHKRDYSKNRWRISRLDKLFKQKYPHLPADKDLPAPKCDFNKGKFYDGI